MSKTLFYILAAIVITSCKTPQMTQYKITTIKKGSLYGAGQEQIPAQNVVITTEEAWKNLLDKINTTNTVISPETTIDFTTQTVLASFMAIKKSGGYSVEITDIETQKDSLVIQTKTTSPATNSMVTQVITQPYHIVTMPISEKPITFKSL